jgi:Ca-activated chloride channel family protein
MAPAGRAAAYGGGELSIEEVRALAATEAHRLWDASGAEPYERRELLEDLSSRLAVLVAALTAPEFAPLHALVTLLNGDAALDAKWTAALDTLAAYGEGRPTGGSASDASSSTGGASGGGGGGGTAAARKPFWKRD